MVANVPASRLDPVDGLLDADPELRVRRARGQSFPDLIALRSGRLGAVPDAVARPTTNGDVRRLIEYARATGARLIPYGGGTSVVGGISARPSADPLITVDLRGLNDVRALDERSGLVTVGAGITGLATAAIFVLIFPGNISQHVSRIDAFGLTSDGARLARLFSQPLLVAWALWCTDAWRVFLRTRRLRRRPDGRRAGRLTRPEARVRDRQDGSGTRRAGQDSV